MSSHSRKNCPRSRVSHIQTVWLKRAIALKFYLLRLPHMSKVPETFYLIYDNCICYVCIVKPPCLLDQDSSQSFPFIMKLQSSLLQNTGCRSLEEKQNDLRHISTHTHAGETENPWESFVLFNKNVVLHLDNWGHVSVALESCVIDWSAFPTMWKYYI